jgi:hypothetical protein
MHEVNVLDFLPIEAGAFYVMDRGYLDFTLTCPDIFEPVGFRDNGSSHLRSSDEASEVYGRADRSNIARGG